MTSANFNGLPLTPEQKLASAKWRLTHSWWIWPPLLSLGFLGWLGFLVAAIKTGETRYKVFAAVYAGTFVGWFALMGNGIDALAIPLFLATWLVPTIHSAFWNRRYLVERASQGEWFQNPAVTVALGQPGVAPAAATGPILGLSQSQYYASPQPTGLPPTQHVWSPPPPQPNRAPTALHPAAASAASHPAARTGRTAPAVVNVNKADEAALCAVHGVSKELARRIVSIRDTRGPYRNLDDLVEAAFLEPHQLVRLRNVVTFSDPQGPPSTSTGRRVLDF